MPAHMLALEHSVTTVWIPGRSRSRTIMKAVGAALGYRLSGEPSRDVLLLGLSAGAPPQVVVNIVVSSSFEPAVGAQGDGDAARRR
jgi:hypothetical protein